MSTRTFYEQTFVLTARDVGAAGHILEIAKALMGRGSRVLLLAQGPAKRYFELRNQPALSGEAFFGIEDNVELSSRRIQIASMKLKQARPDAVICGLSGCRSIGVDEVAVAAAREIGIKSFAVQDFWGDTRLINGAPADHYLVMDELAKELTKEKGVKQISVVGSCKHVSYEKCDFDLLREHSRKQVAVGANTRIVTFFGQNLSALSGYRKVVSDTAVAAGKIGGRFIYRPHPRESQGGTASICSLLDGMGCLWQLDQNLHVEEAIACSDVVVSCFSTAGLDAVQLARIARGKGPVVVYADYPDDLRWHWREHCRVEKFPLVLQGCAMGARNAGELHLALKRALDMEVRKALECQIAETIPDATGAVRRAIEVILCSSEAMTDCIGEPLNKRPSANPFHSRKVGL